MTAEPHPLHQGSHAFAWTPPAPPGPPPPGLPPTGPLPPSVPPPPGGVGPQGRPRRPWAAIIAVVAVAAVLAIVGSAVVLVQARNRDERRMEEEEAQALADDQADLASAVADGDTGAVVRLVDGRAELLDDAERVEVGGEEPLEVDDLGYVAVEVTLESDSEYVIAAAGDDADLVLLAPRGDAAQVVDDDGVVVAEASGRHTLLVAAGRGDEATVAVARVRTEELGFDEAATFTLEEPGEVLDLTFDVRQGEVYDWATFDGPGLEAELRDGAGSVVEVTEQDDGASRFVPAADDQYRIRVTGETRDAVGDFEVDVFPVAKYTAYFGEEESDPAYLERIVEPESFRPLADVAADRIRFCFFLREDVGLRYQIDPVVPGATFDLQVFDGDADPPTPLNTITGVQDGAVTIDPGDADRRFCYALALTGGPSSGVIVAVEET